MTRGLKAALALISAALTFFLIWQWDNYRRQYWLGTVYEYTHGGEERRAVGTFRFEEKEECEMWKLRLKAWSPEHSPQQGPDGYWWRDPECSLEFDE